MVLEILLVFVTMACMIDITVKSHGNSTSKSMAEILPYSKDRLGVLALWPWQLWRRGTIVVFPLYNLSLVVAQLNADKAGSMAWCPNQRHLNTEQLLSFNRMSETICVVAILGGWYIHRRGVLDLRGNYTFNITRPSELVTTGIYAYVRHPGMMGLLLASAGHMKLYVFRLDGGSACLLSEGIVEFVHRWQWPLSVVVMGVLPLWAMWTRVADEERVLKEVIGTEFERYQNEVARFVPGIF
jgi:protein-S-isoprenylcysteine O-methyltransferase Ste14